MRTWFANIAAVIVTWILQRLLSTKTDEWFSGVFRKLEKMGAKLGANPDTLLAIGDAASLFENGPETSAIARRFLLEADPTLLKATVRGALMD